MYATFSLFKEKRPLFRFIATANISPLSITFLLSNQDMKGAGEQGLWPPAPTWSHPWYPVDQTVVVSLLFHFLVQHQSFIILHSTIVQQFTNIKHKKESLFSYQNSNHEKLPTDQDIHWLQLCPKR